MVLDGHRPDAGSGGTLEQGRREPAGEDELEGRALGRRLRRITAVGRKQRGAVDGHEDGAEGAGVAGQIAHVDEIGGEESLSSPGDGLGERAAPERRAPRADAPPGGGPPGRPPGGGGAATRGGAPPAAGGGERGGG